MQMSLYADSPYNNARKIRDEMAEAEFNSNNALLVLERAITAFKKAQETAALSGQCHNALCLHGHTMQASVAVAMKALAAAELAASTALAHVAKMRVDVIKFHGPGVPVAM